MDFNDMTMRDVFLSESELLLIQQCLDACVNGPFFPDWEYSTLIGLERSEVKHILSLYPNLDFEDPRVVIVLRNSLINLLGYPHGRDEELLKYVPEGYEGIQRLMRKLKLSGL